MIPKKYRLILSSQQPFIGDKHHGRWCLIITSPSDYPQWAVSVSKKIEHLATGRNRLRRQLNHWLYQHKDDLAPQKFLIIIRHQPNPKDIPQLFDELKYAVFNLKS